MNESSKFLRHLILPLMRFLFLSFLLTTFLSISRLAGGMPCVVIDNYRDVSNFQKYVQKTSAYAGLPPRMIPDDYAQDHNLDRDEFSKQISPSGKLRCGAASASANLTLSSMVLTTAGHNVCESPVPMSMCEFVYVYEGFTKHVAIDKVASKGYDCSSQPSGSNDWAVLKLKTPAEGPTPYKLNRNLVNTMGYPSDVIVVADHSRDFCSKDVNTHCVRDKKTKKFVYPRFVEDCHLNGISRHLGIAYQQQTDCGGSFGTSGASVIDKDLNSHTILGIIVSIDETDKEIAEQQASGTPSVHEYSDNRMTVSIPLSGSFADAVEQAAAPESN